MQDTWPETVLKGKRVFPGAIVAVPEPIAAGAGMLLIASMR